MVCLFAAVVGWIVLGCGASGRTIKFSRYPRRFLQFLKGEWGLAGVGLVIGNPGLFSDSPNNFISHLDSPSITSKKRNASLTSWSSRRPKNEARANSVESCVLIHGTGKTEEA